MEHKSDFGLGFDISPVSFDRLRYRSCRGCCCLVVHNMILNLYFFGSSLDAVSSCIVSVFLFLAVKGKSSAGFALVGIGVHWCEAWC